MLSVIETYQNGCLILDKEYSRKNPIKVIVTFLEKIENNTENRLDLTDFSFSKSRKNLKRVIVRNIN